MWIKDSGFRAECIQQSGGFFGQEPAVRSLAERAVQQQDARWMSGMWPGKTGGIGQLKGICANIRQV
jgi:hypothetical protein